jgi:hypothetical protein
MEVGVLVTSRSRSFGTLPKYSSLISGPRADSPMSRSGTMTEARGECLSIPRIQIESMPDWCVHAALPVFVMVFSLSKATAWQRASSSMPSDASASAASSRRTVRLIRTWNRVPEKFWSVASCWKAALESSRCSTV